MNVLDLPLATENRARAAHTTATPLRVVVPVEAGQPQPVTVGVPIPRGLLTPDQPVALLDADRKPVPCQATTTTRWPDGSVKWLLVDFLASTATRGAEEWSIRLNEAVAVCSSAFRRSGEPPEGGTTNLRVREEAHQLKVDTGAFEFRLGAAGPLLSGVQVQSRELLGAGGVQLLLVDVKNAMNPPRIERREWESRGPLRATLRLEGGFRGHQCRFIARLCFFAGTGLLRLRLTLHNPKAARHRSGLWDLGDSGSFLFRGLAVETAPARTQGSHIRWQPEPTAQVKEQAGDALEIYQDSSGGENWKSRNHVNRLGQIPLAFRGYRVRAAAEQSQGHRANPVVSLRTQLGTVAAAIPEFWQQFPKSMEVRDGKLRLGLFPTQFGDLHELQGGEQKTHTVWLHFGGPETDGLEALRWVHDPAWAGASSDWIANAGVLPFFLPGDPSEERLEGYLAEAVAGPRNRFARRETIDEYGWRNYGELHADHEEEYYQGPKPIISHYNNQYDVVLGGLTQFLRTGDRRWWEIADPLARHVVDIDIYHTRRDRPAYNGGLFWITDHYKDAGTATHRTFSRINCPKNDPASYGGGPGAEHNFTTGLALYYFLTGDTLAFDAALGLADWVIRMEEGAANILGLVDDGPTGLASRTRYDHYHGPGRGAGNSINALLDGWQLSGEGRYLTKADELLRRAIHPGDDVAARDLLNAEVRWSATIFFSVLDRYLTLKAEAGRLDEMYAYARTAFLRYAGWLVEHERPYYDHPERLEYHTETWAAQELRKANVLRLAARHAVEPLRARLLQRGHELAERAWTDLNRFEARFSTRALALVLAEGPRGSFFRTQPLDRTPSPANQPDRWEPPEPFTPQRERVRRQLRTPSGFVRALVRAANPLRWRRLLRSRR